MATLSPARQNWPVLEGLKLLSRGKVRDTYDLGDGLLLVVATDGISIFDFVLNALVPEKGIVLTAMNYFWLKYLDSYGFKTHYVAAGPGIDHYLPDNLCKNIDLQRRAMVVQKLEMAPVEFVVRAVLTGSSVKPYNKEKTVCGHYLPDGLQDGDALDHLLDTPTSKEEEGHDKPLSAKEIRRQYPEMTYYALQTFQIVSAYAKAHGILLADTKIEGSADTIGDELFTPDSSRFWEYNAWLESRKPATGRKAPAPYDKQLVRNWGIGMGIKDLDPEKPEDVTKVQAMEVPVQLIKDTTNIYRYIFWRLTGKTLECYLKDVMGVAVPPLPAKNVAIICGSENDWPKIQEVVSVVPQERMRIVVNALSCHRHPKQLRQWVENCCGDFDIIIGVGGEALALPGVVDAYGQEFGKSFRTIGVALGEPGTDALRAAELSIERVPGQPVIVDETTGKAYVGPEGLKAVLFRIAEGELPPANPRKPKPFKIGLYQNYR